MKKWIIILALLLPVAMLSFVFAYYQYVGPFKAYDVDISQATGEPDMYQASLSEIQKYQGNLYIHHISQPAASYCFCLQKGKVTRDYHSAYFMNFNDAEHMTGADVLNGYYSKMIRSYDLNDDGDLYVDGKLIAENIEKIEFIRDEIYFVSYQEDRILFSDSKESFCISFEKLGDIDSFYVDESKEILCICENKGPKKYLRIFSIETGEELWRCDDGRDARICENIVCFRTFEGLAIYDLKQNERRDISIDDISSFQIFDKMYIYCVKNNNDVIRINTQTMCEEMVLKSNLNDPIIKFYLWFKQFP